MNNSVITARWLAEVSLMRNTFPEFEPFLRNGLIGFTGSLRGAHGALYQIVIQAPQSGYPAQLPKIYINPRVGTNWQADGALCVSRTWRPERDTFAQQVLYAAAYLQQHG